MQTKQYLYAGFGKVWQSMNQPFLPHLTASRCVPLCDRASSSPRSKCAETPNQGPSVPSARLRNMAGQGVHRDGDKWKVDRLDCSSRPEVVCFLLSFAAVMRAGRMPSCAVGGHEGQRRLFNDCRCAWSGREEDDRCRCDRTGAST